jgi:lysophospholipase L1-like esterase
LRAVTPDARQLYEQGGVHETDWQRVEGEYDRMFALSSDAGAPLGVIYIPQSNPWPPSDYPYPQQRLARWAGAHRVVFVNTVPELQTAVSQGVRVHYPQDGHCTPAGYDLIAKAIAARLLDSPYSPLSSQR